MKSTTPCPGCGETGFWTRYGGSEGARMARTGECFTCAFWEIRATRGCETVIDGWTYYPGNRDRPWSDGGAGHGMSGRRFEIEYFDGRRIVTYDLWSGGEVPKRFRHRFSDTARFVGGASREKVGGY